MSPDLPNRSPADRDVPGGEGATPQVLALTGRAVGAMRAFLAARGLTGWDVYLLPGDPFYDLHRHLPALGETTDDAATDDADDDDADRPASGHWSPTGPSMAGAEGFATLGGDDDIDAAVAPGLPVSTLGLPDAGDDAADPDDPDTDDGPDARPTGAIHLRRHSVAIARWAWVEPAEGTVRSVTLAAAPSPAHLARLRSTLADLRRRAGASVWQVVRGRPWQDGPRRRRDPSAGDELILPQSLRDKIDREVVRFFTPEVAKLHADLGVPHRRGVLLHGPPGNGKTSLIRLTGARLPDVPVLLLRPAADFDGDDLQAVIERWTEQAPAVLVIEDLNWLLKAVNVSTFLNLLDGVETSAERARGVPVGGTVDAGATTPAATAPAGVGRSRQRGGLLLIATTNHPDELDPAINNRPGRFDVVIEVGHPAAEQRRAFLARHLAAFDAADPSGHDGLLDDLSSESDGLSFAHLQEVLRQSGLLALGAARPERTAADLRAAMQTVLATRDDAVRGFPGPAEVPFGLARPRRRRGA